MILCVTLNPCLDKTLVAPAWSPGDSVRGRAIREVVGGKGNNVARALARLGRPARPVTFLGGHVGTRCESLLRRDDGLDPIVIPTAADTRVILTVRTESTPEQTAFFDPDPAISFDESDALFRGVEDALEQGGVEALTLSGSSPSAATHGLYRGMIALAKAKRVPVFLDTYGPSLDAVWGFWPDVIQLNRREASAHLRRPASEGDLAELLDRWMKQGVSCGIVTDGPSPALVSFRGRRYRITPPAIDAVNPIGAGDCLLAGLVDARISGLEPEEMLRHAFACAVANALVWDAGAIDSVEAIGLREAIVIQPL